MHADEHQCVEKVTDREFIKAKKEEKLKSTKKRPLNTRNPNGTEDSGPIVKSPHNTF